MDNNTRPTCDICCFTFNPEERCPKVLRCGHTFCLDCLNQLPVEKKKINCPECRSSQGVPRRGIESLPTNYTLLTLLQSDRRPSDTTYTNNTDDGMVVCTHTLTEEVSLKIPYNMFKQDSFYFPRMNPQGGTASATPRPAPEEPQAPLSLPSIGGPPDKKREKAKEVRNKESESKRESDINLPRLDSNDSSMDSPATGRKSKGKSNQRKKKQKAAEADNNIEDVEVDADFEFDNGTPLAIEDVNDDNQDASDNEEEDRAPVVLIQERKRRETIRLPPVAGVGLEEVCGVASRMFSGQAAEPGAEHHNQGQWS